MGTEKKKGQNPMMEEVFAQGSSFIHRLDPVVRILCAAVFSVAAALCASLYTATVCLVAAVFLILLARLNFRDLFNRIRPVFWFLLMIWILLPITFDRQELISFLGVGLSREGVMLSAMISIKSVTILLVFTALIATMTVATLGHGLHRLYVPDKMVFLLLMSYRYISVIENEYRRLLRAARFRGFRPGTNLHSYKTYAYLAGMLFVRASLRANRVYQAMLCRGFNQKFYTLDAYPGTRSNWVFMTGVFSGSLGLIIIEHVWKIV